jgi:hypothetical protein
LMSPRSRTGRRSGVPTPVSRVKANKLNNIKDYNEILI